MSTRSSFSGQSRNCVAGVGWPPETFGVLREVLGLKERCRELFAAALPAGLAASSAFATLLFLANLRV